MEEKAVWETEDIKISFGKEKAKVNFKNIEVTEEYDIQPAIKMMMIELIILEGDK